MFKWVFTDPVYPYSSMVRLMVLLVFLHTVCVCVCVHTQVTTDSRSPAGNNVVVRHTPQPSEPSGGGSHPVHVCVKLKLKTYSFTHTYAWCVFSADCLLTHCLWVTVLTSPDCVKLDKSLAKYLVFESNDSVLRKYYIFISNFSHDV